MPHPPLLQAQAVSLGYGRASVAQGINFAVGPGELLAVVGHNGSGKSSLIKCLLGLLDPVSGSMRWPASGRPPNIAYLGQRQDLDRSFPMKASDLVASGGWALERAGGGRSGSTSAQALHRATQAAIRAVGLEAVQHLSLHKLSGGQLQRALFARAMVQDAPLVVLDEPFAGVDQSTESDLLALILRWVDQGKAVVLVSHDLSQVLNHATNVLLLGQGRAQFGPPCTTLTPNVLVEHGYMTQGQAQWFAGMYGGRGQSHA